MGEIFGTDGIRDRAGHGFLALPKVTQLARATAKILKETPARFRVAVRDQAHRWNLSVIRDAPVHGVERRGDDVDTQDHPGAAAVRVVVHLAGA